MDQQFHIVKAAEVSEQMHEARNMAASVHGLVRHVLAMVPPRGVDEQLDKLRDTAESAKDSVDQRLLRMERITGGVMDRKQLRIAVVEDDLAARRGLVLMASSCGHAVVAECATCADLTSTARDSINLVIFDIHLPDGDGLSAFHEFSHGVLAGVAVTGDRNMELAHRAGILEPSLSYLVKPVSDLDQLSSAIEIAWSRHEVFRQLQADNAALTSRTERLEVQMAEVNLVRKAKAKLMKDAGLTEPGAYTLMREQSRTHRVGISEIARMVIAGQLHPTLQLGRKPPVESE